ncbi:hypothetical protein SDC9_208698 [bioreactor metagenome]|uniref:Uncharacterized protein n=1 Tax=bioreactor metagenome TaxID=1076179 RepID=A0A645JB91_9ZZZZ
MAGPQGKCPFIVAIRHSPDGGLGNVDDGWQNHDAQKNRGGEHTLAAPKERPHEGHQHHKAKEAINDGRNAGHQGNGGAQQSVYPFGGKTRHINSRQDAQRHAHKDGAGRHIQAPYNHRCDAV